METNHALKTYDRRHPLEVIPFFRQFPRSIVRDLVYTFIMNLLFCVFFFLIRWPQEMRTNLPRWIWGYFLVSNCIGYAIHFEFLVGRIVWGDWLKRQSFAIRAAYFTILPTAGIFAGYFLGFVLLQNIGEALHILQTQSASILVSGFITSLVLCIIFALRERQASAEAALAEQRSHAIESEKQALAAHLRLLQAQIEPHFLFNTLANVVGLIDAEPTTAKRMLESFVAYLRSALGAARAERTTLAGEANLLRAYLDVIAVRMDTRLRYHIDVPVSLTTAAAPAMLLQPLVENAIKHGIEPKVDGGEVTVAATSPDGRVLRLTVSDTGLGFRPHGSGGVGLANLRERLFALYDGRASLNIEDNTPCGTKVILTIPLEAQV